MPEFVLNLGGQAKAFAGLDAFTQGYIEAMFFTSEESLCEDEDSEWDMPNVAVNTATMESRFVGGNTPSFADLAPETVESIKADCEAFQISNAALLDSVYGVTGKYERAPYDAERAGADYWFTRNGHGCGFWDRGLGEPGDALSAAARHSGRCLYRGDDGLLYLG